MAEDDIYKSKRTYDRLVESLDEVAQKSKSKNPNYKHYCKNPKNKKYFEKLLTHFEARDLSYIRRCKLIYALKIITYATEKVLSDC
jgi:hypothetical protein